MVNRDAKNKGDPFDNLLILHFLIKTIINRKKNLYCAFVNFKQASDTVWRDDRWYKLLSSGVNGIFLFLLKTFMQVLN